MNSRARSSSDIGWGRARGAYAALIAESDPAASDVAAGAVDLRPGYNAGDLEPSQAGHGRLVVAGPGDLIELHEVVERMTGFGTWHTASVPSGFVVVATRRGSFDLERPAPALALVMALEAQIEDRSRAWRTWKTVVESVAAAIPAGSCMSIEALVLARP